MMLIRISQISLFIAIGMAVTLNIFAQEFEPWKNPNYGSDSLSRIQCAQNLSLASEFIKINLMDNGLPFWKQVLEDCPAASKNIYLHGVRIYTFFIEKAEDQSTKIAFLDTLMMVYDKRIEHFGEEGIVLGRKGMDILKYGGMDAFEDAYHNFHKSTNLLMTQTDANVLIGLAETGYAMLMAEKINMERFLENYIRILDIVEEQSKNPRLRSRANMVAQRLDESLAKVNISDCNHIEQAFKNRIDTNPEDEKFNLKISDLLRNAGCEKEDFYRLVQLNLLKSNPSADINAEIAKHYIRNDNYPEALNYLLKSFELETSADKKSQYAQQIAIIYCSKMDMHKEGAEYALQAAEFNPAWADPYFILSMAYVEGIKQCTNDPFERSAIYWLVVDLLEAAKKADPSVTEKANNMIQEYSRYFPAREESFFRSLNAGRPYKIGCWINRTTTVRMN